MYAVFVRRELAVLALIAPVTGCFFTPAKPGEAPTDAHAADTAPDVPRGPTPVVRKIANAWYSSEDTPSTGMSASGYSVPTAGITNGDLVLFIGNIDNGNNSTWQLPTPQFHQLAQLNYGGDGQTFFAAWTIANNEPSVYQKGYIGGLNSAASAIELLAVTGVDPTTPIEDSPYKVDGTYQSPVILASDGVTTTVPDSLVIFAGGADWGGPDQTAAFQAPPGYDVLDAFSDRGGITFQWTTLLVGDKPVHAVGPTGAESGMVTANSTGAPWTIEIAIAPAPAS